MPQKHNRREATESEILSIQKVILPLFAAREDGAFRPIGSCWIFAAAGSSALAFTAAHIFEEVARSEGRHERADRTMPDILRSARPRPVNLASHRIYALYRLNATDGEMVDVQNLYFDGSSDVAVCTLFFSDNSTNGFEKKMAIHSGPVPAGSEIAAVGYGEMEKSRTYTDETTGKFSVEHHHRLTIEYGQCMEYFSQNGPRGSKGPSFEVNVPTLHGMSGGPILIKEYGDEWVGCGVISRGTSFGDQETSISSALWPAYSFTVDAIADGNGAPLTLIELAKRHWVDDKSDGPSHFQMIKASEEDGFLIGWT